MRETYEKRLIKEVMALPEKRQRKAFERLHSAALQLTLMSL